MTRPYASASNADQSSFADDVRFVDRLQSSSTVRSSPRSAASFAEKGKVDVQAFGGAAEARRHDSDFAVASVGDDPFAWPSSRHRGLPRCRDGNLSLTVAELADPAR